MKGRKPARCCPLRWRTGAFNEAGPVKGRKPGNNPEFKAAGEALQ